MTTRQQQIAALRSKGKPLKEIACDLGRSEKTVQFHWAKLCSELGTRDPVGVINKLRTMKREAVLSRQRDQRFYNVSILSLLNWCSVIAIVALLSGCATPVYSPIPAGPPPANPPSALIVLPEQREAKAKPFKPAYTSDTIAWTAGANTTGYLLAWGLVGGPTNYVRIGASGIDLTGLRVGSYYAAAAGATNAQWWTPVWSSNFTWQAQSWSTTIAAPAPAQ